MSLKIINKIPDWLIVLATVIIPSSGYVILGKPFRGLVMLFYMALLAFITYQLSGPEISPFGRFAGGFLIWAISVLEVKKLVKLRERKRYI
ncbi:MAG: hypothetical protein KGZ96_12270 [Clostridia bacterium]|jgi:hypothetical protein|nr:hypothetical protein [Clostridia bacterium]